MKTAMQELYDKVLSPIDDHNLVVWLLANGDRFIEKEKQQIIEAVDKTRGYISGERYFNETYGPKPLGIFNHDLNLNDTINQKDLRAAIDKVNGK